MHSTNMRRAKYSSTNANSNSNNVDSKVHQLLQELYQLIQQTQEERNRSEHNLTNIAKTHERMQHEQKAFFPSHCSVSPYYKTKLRGLYNTAMQDAESEVDFLRKALEKIAQIKALGNERRSGRGSSQDIERPKQAMRRGALMMMLQQHALSLPLWEGQPGEKPPPLCGAVQADSNYIAKQGDKVAARVKGPDGDENWILAEVVSYNMATNKYEVDDVDEEQREYHVLSRRRVVPLPIMKANPETDPESLFPKGTLVMALYPQTTCFYRALIHEPPKTADDDYLVLFEDTSYPDGYSPPLSVAQRYVVACKDNRKK